VISPMEQSKPNVQKVSKLEGAERLLKASVRLFFEEIDILAVHSLAAAAHEVLRTLLLREGKKGSFLKDNDYIKPEYAKEYHDLMNHPQNFLKHADRDPEGVLDFYEDGTPFWILDAIGLYTKLTGKMQHRDFFIFFAWFAQQYPMMLKKGALQALVAEAALKAIVSKQHFLQILKNPSLLITKGFS